MPPGVRSRVRLGWAARAGPAAEEREESGGAPGHAAAGQPEQCAAAPGRREALQTGLRSVATGPAASAAHHAERAARPRRPSEPRPLAQAVLVLR